MSSQRDGVRKSAMPGDTKHGDPLMTSSGAMGIVLDTRRPRGADNPDNAGTVVERRRLVGHL